MIISLYVQDRVSFMVQERVPQVPVMLSLNLSLEVGEWPL